MKLNPLAEWTEDEVWDYVRERGVPYHALYDQGYTSIGCEPCTRAIEPGEAEPRGPLVVGVERAEGVRHPLLDRERRPRARAPRDPRRETHALSASSASAGRRRRSLLAEAQAVLAMVQDEERRGRLADVVAAIGDGEVEGADADALAELLELGLSDRPRPRALRPGRRAGRARAVPAAPARPELRESDPRAERGAARRSRAARSSACRSTRSVLASTA